MREIKFRAWIKEKKEMLYNPISICGIGGGINTIFTKDYPDRVWMQYTGLKDKNGKEIYEGDIVEDVNTDAIGYVNFDEASFNCGNTFDYKGFVELCLRERIQVIGNIHETPELTP